jgi:CRISPR-associated endonuclease Cas1
MSTERHTPTMAENNKNSSILPSLGVVTLYGYGLQARVDRGHLLIEDRIGSAHRYARLPRVGHGLRRLVVIGSEGVVSLAALRWLADQDVAFIMLERDGSVLATTGPVRSSDAKLRRAQALAHQSGTAVSIARELISRKLAAQEGVARQKLLDCTTADEIARFKTELQRADSITTVRLIESQAARVYWSAWSNLSVNFPKNELRRVPEHWRTFGTRVSPLTGSPRLAANPANAILNYLYSLLEAEARLSAAGLGLDPGLGVLHVDTAARDSLACDLMEPVRPQVDAYVLDWITRQPFKREWFFERADGHCRLMAPFASHLSLTARTWERAVAPIAEWVAQAFWDSVRTSSKIDRFIPTRLTERRRRESRGFTSNGKSHPVLRPMKICKVCGAEGVKSSYCQSCAVEASRERMADIAALAHMRPKSKMTKIRISRTLSDHAVANTWWEPSSLPSWLTQECYAQRIQPLLRAKKVRTIAEVMQVSKPYAAFIRAGRRRPHPRHWQALAEVVGVTGPLRCI